MNEIARYNDVRKTGINLNSNLFKVLNGDEIRMAAVDGINSAVWLIDILLSDGVDVKIIDNGFSRSSAMGSYQLLPCNSTS